MVALRVSVLGSVREGSSFDLSRLQHVPEHASQRNFEVDRDVMYINQCLMPKTVQASAKGGVWINTFGQPFWLKVPPTLESHRVLVCLRGCYTKSENNLSGGESS